MTKWETQSKAMAGERGSWSFKADDSGVFVWPTRRPHQINTLAAALDRVELVYEENGKKKWRPIGPKELSTLALLADELEGEGLF